MQRLRIKPITLYGLNTAITFIVTILIFSVFTPDHLFLDPRNLGSLAKLTPDIGIVALGIGILMICGEFDLSIASVLPFCSYIFTQLLILGINPFIGLILVLPIGASFGLINGILVVSTGLPSFILTLATMLFWRGLLYGVSRMMPISILSYISNYPAFENVLTGQIGPIPVQILWFLFFAVILGLLLHQNRFGNWVYATGSNQEAARAMGVNVRLVKTLCYMIIGVLCAFVGVMQSVRLGSFAATQGIGFELKTIAAVVVGGTSLTGGVGSMLGICLGIFIIRIVENGLILMQVPVFGVETFIGIAVVVFVVINNYMSRQVARQAG
ncbi:MAG: ABC transporter permease [Deltaproteobacteria bacterium]|nr:MAG: ABC transporter permease [Deltaproteobacteria bacterium]